MHKLTPHVEILISKAAAAHDSADAMRFSQSAQNATNAMIGLREIGELPREADSSLKRLMFADSQIKHMAQRFLGWKLPEDFTPDCGISFAPDFNQGTARPQRHQPTGTNLLGYSQAEAMIRYLVEEMPVDGASDPA